MEKTDFDACLKPVFSFCYSYDALYTPICVALMHVSPSFVSDNESRIKNQAIYKLKKCA